jgi:hypothetical protein
MGHLNKTFYNYMTTQDAWDEYLELIKEDEHFAEQWSNTKDDFLDWCEADDIVLVDNKQLANELEEAQLQ